MSRLRTIVRRVWIAAGLLFLAWMAIGFQATGVPPDTLQSDTDVVVTVEETGVWFRPQQQAEKARLLFLPGGLVEPLAYAPLLRAIARDGFVTRLEYLPLRSAFTSAQMEALFDRVRAISSTAGPWVLAGHSRGAMLAARLAREGRVQLAGLALIATTHPRDFSLQHLTIPVTKILASEDGVAPASKQNWSLLPAHTRWVEIAGGNHAGFAHYRHQLFDGSAGITREVQQLQTREALLLLLKSTSADATPSGRPTPNVGVPGAAPGPDRP